MRPLDNPTWLKQQAQGLMSMGDPAQAQQGAEYLKHATDITSGAITPQFPDGAPYNGFARYNQSLGNQSAVEASYAQQKALKNAASEDFTSHVSQAYQTQAALNRIYGETNTNRLTPELADLVGKASSLPGLRDAIAPAWQKYEAANDEATKETALQTIVQAVSSGLGAGAPASSLSTSSHTVGLPTMAPGARYDLAVQRTALLRQKQDYFADWGKFKGNVDDVSTFDQDWVAAHPVSAYEGWAYNHIMPFAGMTPQEKLAHPRRPATPADITKYPSGTPYVVPYDGANLRKGQIGWVP